MTESIEIHLDGGWSGRMSPAFVRESAQLSWLSPTITPRSPSDKSRRSEVFRTDLVTPSGTPIAVAVKRFPAPTWWRRARVARHGSKAARAWNVAMRMCAHGVGTPEPIAYLERRIGGRLFESVYVCRHIPQGITFRDELVRLMHEDPEYSRITTLMHTVARAISAMHKAGIIHRDLGNQNIFVRPDGPDSWKDVAFFDLNRATLHDAVTERLRARDLCRITLPSALRALFFQMVFEPELPSRTFLDAEKAMRRSFALHTMTRRWRRPIWEARIRRRTRLDPRPDYLPEREIWIWDRRTEHMVPPLLRPEWPRSLLDHISPGDWHAHPPRRNESACSSDQHAAAPLPFALKNRLGLALPAHLMDAEPIRTLLNTYRNLPVRVRIWATQSAQDHKQIINSLHNFHKQGHPINAVLVQDRAAIRHPERWSLFLNNVLPEIAPCADSIQIGETPNLPYSGIHTLEEFRQLHTALAPWIKKYPDVRWLGSGCQNAHPSAAACLLEFLPTARLNGFAYTLQLDPPGKEPPSPSAGLGSWLLEPTLRLNATRLHDPSTFISLTISCAAPKIHPTTTSHETPNKQALALPMTGPLLPTRASSTLAFFAQNVVEALCSREIHRVVGEVLVTHADEFDTPSDSSMTTLSIMTDLLALTVNATSLCREEKDGVIYHHFLQETNHRKLFICWANSNQQRHLTTPAQARPLGSSAPRIQLAYVSAHPIVIEEP